MTETATRKAVVLQPDDGKHFWQPQPTGGYASVKLAAEETGRDDYSMGIQVVPPGGMVRQHAHTRNDEVLFFWEGKGRAIIDGEEHELRPGTTVLAVPYAQHCFINDGDSDLKFVWMMLPADLENWFAAIGRPRNPGEPAPAPFERPADIGDIQDAHGFVRSDPVPEKV